METFCTVMWNTNEDQEKEMVLDKSISGKYITLECANIIWNYNNLRGTEMGNNYTSQHLKRIGGKLYFQTDFTRLMILLRNLRNPI